jgi:hypothetical protein
VPQLLEVLGSEEWPYHGQGHISLIQIVTFLFIRLRQGGDAMWVNEQVGEILESRAVQILKPMDLLGVINQESPQV